MLSYAGIELPLFTPEAIAWVEANLTFQDILEFTYLDSPSFYLGHLAYPGILPRRKIQPGKLWWPRGASRFAVGHFLVADTQASQIRALVESGSYSAAPLVMTWEDAATGVEVARIQPNLYLLPLRPLSQIAGENGCWLMTLVDERYFWWLKNSGDLTITEGTTTWQQLYTALANALGITITVDAIPAAYLKPATWLGVPYDYVPLLLDAVAYNVGQRIVRGLDGTVRARNALNGAADVVNNRALAAARSIQAGGSFLFDAAITPNNIPPQAPQSVTVTFPEVNADSGTNLPNGVLYAQNVTLAALNLPDIPPTTPTSPGSKTFHETAPAQYLGGILQNQAEITALLNQIATDYYRFQLAPLDVKYAGVVPWNPDALHDSVEWTYTAHGGAQAEGEVSTRIQRPPFNDLTQELDHGGGSGGNSPAPCPCPGGGGDGSTRPCDCLPVYPPFPYPPTSPGGTIPLPPAYAKIRFAPTSTLSITGFTGAVNGQVLILWNAGAGTRVTLAHDAGTPATAGILTPLGFEYTLWPRDGLIIEYDGISQRWRFDTPTFAAGFSSAGQAATYASRWLKPGTGITITDNADGSNTIAASALAASNLDLHGWHQSGRWYSWFLATNFGMQAGFFGFLMAHPFLVTHPFAARGIGIVAQNTPAVTRNVRLAVYSNSGPYTLYPQTLLADSGNIPVPAGTAAPTAFSAAININLAPGLYWLAYQIDDAAVFTNQFTISRDYGLLGSATVPTGQDSQIGWQAAFAFAAFPALFPAGGTPQGTVPDIWLFLNDAIAARAAIVNADIAQPFPLPGGAGAVMIG